MLPNFSKTSLLWTVLALGALLRFHALERQSLWDDEMSTLRTISLSPRETLHRFQTYETHPPVYFVQLAAWRSVAGGSLGALRANSAFWGSVSIFLLYLLGSRLGGPSVGRLSAALLALSPLHIAYSQELRPYALSLTLAIAGFIALLDRRWRILTLLWILLLYTHYWGTFVVASAMVYGWMTLKDWKTRRSLLLSGVIAGFLFSFWLPILICQMAVVKASSFWVPPPSWEILGKTFVTYSGSAFRYASSTFLMSSSRPIIFLSAAVYLATLAWGVLRGPRLALVWLGVGLGFPWALSYWNLTPLVWYRYPILMLPAVILLVASGVQAVPRRSWRIGLAALILLGQGWGAWKYFHGWQKANPKAVVEYVQSLEDERGVVVRPSYFADLFSAYYRGNAPVLDPNALDDQDRRAALRGNTILLVAFDVGRDPVTQAFLSEYRVKSACVFPGHSHLGITVYELK